METNQYPIGQPVPLKYTEDLTAHASDGFANQSLSQLEDAYSHLIENPNDAEEIKNWDNT